MKFRKLNKAFAKTFGYFWLPCPLCGQETGGHEWLWQNKPNRPTACIEISTQELPITYQGICKDCCLSGKGEAHNAVRKENQRIIKLWEQEMVCKCEDSMNHLVALIKGKK